MSGQWFLVDGHLRRFEGTHDDIVDATRELRADGHVVRSARPPKSITSRELAARQHQRRR